nr:hypothetical protein [Polyangiaceae bacterium]
AAIAELLRSTQAGDCPQLRVMPDGSVSAHAHVLARAATGAEWAGARRWALRFVASCEPSVAGFGGWARGELGAADRWLLDGDGAGLSRGAVDDLAGRHCPLVSLFALVPLVSLLSLSSLLSLLALVAFLALLAIPGLTVVLARPGDSG